jgi:hypothetical protein
MKYGKDLISRGASTKRTPVMTAVSFAGPLGSSIYRSTSGLPLVEGSELAWLGFYAVFGAREHGQRRFTDDDV